MATLKNKNIAKLPVEKQEKMQKTLDKMVARRKTDGRNLRKDIENKLEWAITEKEKGLEVIEKQHEQIKNNQETMLKLDGIITVLTQLLETKPETTEEIKEE